MIGGRAALGPLLGRLPDHRALLAVIFYINLPIGCCVAAGALSLVPETRDPSARRGPIPGVLPRLPRAWAVVFANHRKAQRYGWLQPTALLALGVRWPFDSVSDSAPRPRRRGAPAVRLPRPERRRGEAGRTVVVDLTLCPPPLVPRHLAALIVSLASSG